MEPRLSLDTLELEPGERLKLLAPFLVITDRGRAFSAPWSRWRPLKLSKWGVVRAVFEDQVIEGGMGTLVAQAFLGASPQDRVVRRDTSLGWEVTNLKVYPAQPASPPPKPTSYAHRPTRARLEDWLRPKERFHDLDDDPTLGVVITDQGRVFFKRSGVWVSAKVDEYGRFYAKTQTRTFKRKLSLYVAKYFMGAKDHEVPIQKPHATGWGVKDLVLKPRGHRQSTSVSVSLGFSPLQHQQMVRIWGQSLERELKALILAQLPKLEPRARCIRVAAKAGLSLESIATLAQLELESIKLILKAQPISQELMDLDGPWCSDWLDQSARAVVWRWLLQEQGLSLDTLAHWERIELKALQEQVKALGIKP